MTHDAEAEEAAKAKYDKRLAASVAKLEQEDPVATVRLRIVTLRKMGWKEPPTSPLGVMIYDRRYMAECQLAMGWPTFADYWKPS